MRVKGKANDPFPALAIAGTHVVLLGWDYPAAAIRKDKVPGFAIERTRKADVEVIWLLGQKSLEAVEPNPAPGVQVSSYKHRLQTFQWSDYTVEADHEYCSMHGPSCDPPGETSVNVTEAYLAANEHVVRDQLKKAGVRLAHLLDRIFAD